jgi:ABC-type amino acid transport system permease subunit
MWKMDQIVKLVYIEGGTRRVGVGVHFLRCAFASELHQAPQMLASGAPVTHKMKLAAVLAALPLFLLAMFALLVLTALPLILRLLLAGLILFLRVHAVLLLIIVFVFHGVLLYEGPYTR